MPECIFCQISSGQAPAAVVWRDEHCMAFMDVFPWAPGHVLVIPHMHAQHIHELTPELRQQLFEVANRIRIAMPDAGIPCDGANFFINDGKAANQTVGHVHLHVLPRKFGDGRTVLRSFTARWLKLAMGKAEPVEKLRASADPLQRVLQQ